MPRAKRGFKRRRRANKVLERASGFVLGRKNLYRRAAEAVDRSFIFAYRDRKVRKRDFRQLWITRLSAAAHQNDISYSRLIAALKKNGVILDRKVLSDIAIHDASGFSALVSQVRASAPLH